MVHLLPSTFKLLDQALPVIDDRRSAVALIRHFTTPLTVLADMIIGLAHILFLGARLQLTEKTFWDIAHAHFFVYPFQAFVYFIFASLGTVWSRNYFDGYRWGQWAVMDLSKNLYQGPPQIFSHIIERYESPQFFTQITLADQDHYNLQEVVRHTNLFTFYVDKIEGDHELKCAGPIYKAFYAERPLSIHTLDEIYQQKLLLLDGGCNVREALSEAKLALEAFFSLPRVVRAQLNSCV